MIFIIGFTASGKTTLGRSLALFMKRPFFDLDEEIEKSSGMGVNELFETRGEPEFRKLETGALERLISVSPKESIIATGGGTPCFNDNIKLLLKSGLVVYIVKTIDEILQNLNLAELQKRPLIPGSGEVEIRSWLTSTLTEREPYYSSAHLKVPSNVAKSPELFTNAIILFTKGKALERS